MRGRVPGAPDPTFFGDVRWATVTERSTFAICSQASHAVKHQSQEIGPVGQTLGGFICRVVLAVLSLVTTSLSGRPSVTLPLRMTPKARPIEVVLL